MPITVAIFSPNENSYSETFIQAHKRLPFTIKYYYGGLLPSALESQQDILSVAVPERIKRRFIKGFSFAEKKLLFSLRKQKVDCVLAEYGHTACHSLKVISYLRLPLVVHFHGSDASNTELLLQYKEKYQEVFRYASSVVAVSDRMYDALLNLGCPKEKLIITACGPAASFFDLAPTFNNRQFLSVGRFVEKKAPHLTIFAFRKVLDVYPSARLIMVGDGELLTVCKSLAKLLELQNNIEFKGVCSGKPLQDLFQQSIAFVQHSVTAESGDAEGTPVAVLEAQAAGLPVVSTYHGGIAEVVIDKQTGLLGEEHDVEGMAKNMLRLLQEDGLANRLGIAGRERTLKYFSLEKHLDDLAGIIKEAQSANKYFAGARLK